MRAVLKGARAALWPATLRGRLIALLLIALVASQAISAFLFVDERRRAVRAALGREAVARVASVALLVEQTPSDRRAGLLAAVSTPLARFRLDAAPVAMPGPPDRRALRMRAHLVSAMTEMSDADWPQRVRVGPVRWRDGRRGEDHRGEERQGEERWSDERRGDDPWRDRRPRGPYAASIRLHDGAWLNVRFRLRPPPPLQLTWPSLVSMALMAAAIVLVVTVTIGRATRPLRDLADAADRFGRGARDAPTPERGPQEARRLIAAFNAMRARLIRFVEDRTRLFASISHDLRTPITAMRLRVELLEDGETKTRLIDGLEEMQRLAEATLLFAREEAVGAPMRAVDLRALVESVVEDFADMGADVRVEPTAAGVTTAPGPADGPSAPPRLVQECRPDALKRALRNLVENAVRHAGAARLSVTETAEGVVIAVTDDGPGIHPAERIEEMFEPFARLETSRSRETGGVGLGLSIARTIARAHGGEARLSNRPEGGLRAELTLPRRP